MMIARSLALASLCACTRSPSTDTTCTIDFSGNLAATESAPACASFSKTAETDVLFVIDTTSATAGRLQLSIDLGPTPTEGTFTSDVVTTWNALALGFGDANCSLTAGNANVPIGSFVLTLAPFDAATSTPHGDITLVMYVHAPPDAACGPVDFENLHVHF